MTTSFLSDALAHHVWATERLIDACTALTPDELNAPAAGTYGSIIATLRHLVSSDGWYLTFFPSLGPTEVIDEEEDVGLDELRAAMTADGAAWTRLLAAETDAERDVTERDDAWEFHAPLGFRLAQVIHHGTDHRSQICTAMTNLGLTPPEIDVWAYGKATGRTRAVERGPTEPAA